MKKLIAALLISASVIGTSVALADESTQPATTAQSDAMMQSSENGQAAAEPAKKVKKHVKHKKHHHAKKAEATESAAPAATAPEATATSAAS